MNQHTKGELFFNKKNEVLLIAKLMTSAYIMSRMDRLVLSHTALPHMMSTLVEDTLTRSLQLLTSGTCDLVR